MFPKAIQDFIKTLAGESPSYSTVKKRAAEFKRRRARRIMNGLGILEATTEENAELVQSDHK